MSETVYIETSIIGYLTARPSNNLILMANLEATREWWEDRRSYFTLYISQTVLDEVARGDREIAAKRLEVLNDFPLLAIDESVQNLASQFLSKSNLPPKAADDALHMAVATIYSLDYLLTWNCKHIANAQIQKKLAQISLNAGYELPNYLHTIRVNGGLKMWKDEVLEEIYKIREEHAKAFNYDLQAICDDLRKKQAESGKKIISKPLKQLSKPHTKKFRYNI